LIICGVSDRSVLTSATVPDTGEKISDTDFVDSTSQHAAMAATATPTCGRST
jgi:hypothetical protein